MNYNYNFDDKKKIKKKHFIFVIVFLILVIIITSIIFKNSNNKFMSAMSDIVLSPFKSGYNVFHNISNNSKDHFANIKKLNSENQQLQQKVNELEAKNLESKKILDENESLKKMLKINTVFQHFNLKYANIISRQHDKWNQTFIINIGSNDGIKKDQAVVHEDGLVGYISKVNDTTSVVTTIFDPTTSVSVNISTINEPAILQGDITLSSNNQLKLEYIPIGATVSDGDILYTSGLGTRYPSGIPVAKINEVINNKNDADRYAKAESCVNVRTISEVGVIIN